MIRLAAAAFAASLIAAPAFAEPVAFTVDKSHSTIFFSVDHLGFSTIHGHFAGYDADVVLDEEDLANSKASVTIDVSSLDTFWDARTEHLLSADFLDAKQFPTATFVSRSFEQTGESTVAVTGDLTLHGVTKEVVIDFVITKVGDNPMTNVHSVGLVGTTTLTRSDFGVGAYAPAVADEVPLRIDMELNQAK